MDWLSHLIPGSLPNGTPILSVLAKRTYSVGYKQVTLADEQEPFIEADEFFNPESVLNSEIKAENELVAFKPFIDFVVTGKAKTPEGKQAYYLDITVSVGSVTKVIRVFGERTIESRALRGLAFTEPQPFSELEIGYRYAYGGSALTKSDTFFSYPSNPIGMGFTLKAKEVDVSTLRVPHIEDPQTPLTPDDLLLAKPSDWTNAPKPVSLGWTRRNFFPRYTYAGILPEHLEGAKTALDEQKKNGLATADMTLPPMDFRMYQGASEGLWLQNLKGNEPVRIAYMDAAYPNFEFFLPGDIPTIKIKYDGVENIVKPEIQTIVIDKERNIMTIIWRGYLPYEGIMSLATKPLTGFSATSELY